MVRTFWEDETEKWYFCINDVVWVLTDCANPADYFKTLRKRDADLDNFVRGSICPPHQFISTDGKKHSVKCADLNTLTRIIQSIPSKKSEEFKQWITDISKKRPDGEAIPNVLIYSSDDGLVHLDVQIDGQTVWLTQQQMADLFGRDRTVIGKHIANVYEEGELNRDTTCAKFAHLGTADYFNLDMIISVGYRVHSIQGVRFRQWATARLKEYIVKGFALDDERLKGRGNRYFKELLQRIRDIRSSERNLYQQVTDIYATSIDYDPHCELTQNFYATVQNKMHYAAHQHTAAELIYERVDNEKPMLGMTNFKGDYITKDDVVVAKNYLSEKELTVLNLLVSQFLDYAELQAVEEHSMTMQGWIDELDHQLLSARRLVLPDKGKVSHIQAVEKAEKEYTLFRQREYRSLESDYDRAVRQLELFSETEIPEQYRDKDDEDTNQK